MLGCCFDAGLAACGICRRRRITGRVQLNDHKAKSPTDDLGRDTGMAGRASHVVKELRPLPRVPVADGKYTRLSALERGNQLRDFHDVV